MYKLLVECLQSDEGEIYTAYGILCTENEVCISDVSLNKNKMELFLKIINEGKLAYIHLRDVIDDCINDLI